eukprot:NODE_27265_length_212_cov_1.337423_g26095_i0.p1 GENE.NODE_27265_length_212_cov_1.337423_g26095_i0~~NODE_27265_length_212_cov_1.337423_g26095_i0.p1  ORF type:complete len:64 (-),score=0.08 NODE_27265_length_212_cov_1.337423_g26095_i0:19-210(-)
MVSLKLVTKLVAFLESNRELPSQPLVANFHRHTGCRRLSPLTDRLHTLLHLQAQCESDQHLGR